MNLDERLQALTESLEIIAGMQLKNEETIKELSAKQQELTAELAVSYRELAVRHDALVQTQSRTFELVSTVGTHVDRMAHQIADGMNDMAQSVNKAVDRLERNMGILIQYAHRHEDWLEELEKRDKGERPQ